MIRRPLRRRARACFRLFAGCVVPTPAFLAPAAQANNSLSINDIKTCDVTIDVVDLRGGFRFGEGSSVTVILENLFDRNYRTMGSGIDAPGRNAMIRYSHSF